jgi:hypothetical protein
VGFELVTAPFGSGVRFVENERELTVFVVGQETGTGDLGIKAEGVFSVGVLVARVLLAVTLRFGRVEEV